MWPGSWWWEWPWLGRWPWPDSWLPPLSPIPFPEWGLLSSRKLTMWEMFVVFVLSVHILITSTISIIVIRVLLRAAIWMLSLECEQTLPGKCSLKSILDSRVGFCGRNCCVWLESHYFFRRRRDASVHSRQGARWWVGVVVAAVAAVFGVGVRGLDLWGGGTRRGRIKRVLSFVLDVRFPTGLFLTLFFDFWQDVWKSELTLYPLSLDGVHLLQSYCSVAAKWQFKLLNNAQCWSEKHVQCM